MKKGITIGLGLFLLAGALWAQDGFTARLATALQQMGWTQDAAQLMVRQQAQWQRAEGADAEGVALALKYALRNSGLEVQEQARLAVQVAEGLKEMNALGFRDREAARAMLQAMRQAMAEAGSLRGDGELLRLRLRDQVRLATSEHSRLRLRQQDRDRLGDQPEDIVPGGPSGQQWGGREAGSRQTRRMHGSLITRVHSAVGRKASPPLLLWILAGLLAAASLPAQGLEAALARGRFSPEQQQALEAQFREAELQGIPVSLLLPRLEEGIAKKAPAARLQEALRRQAGLLLEARTLLVDIPGGDSLLADPASWARTANLLSGALPAAEVRLLVGYCARRPADYRPATYLYLSLVEWGLEPELSRQLLKALLDSSLPGESFPVVMEILVEGRRQRLAPEQLVRRLLLRLPGAASAEELKRGVLR